MVAEKTCPKCPNSVPMKTNGIEAIIPAVLDPRFPNPDGPISKKAGLPVQTYVCPNCNFVELYYSPS
jgi:hypothetical protein